MLALFDYLPLELNCGLTWIGGYFGSRLFGFHVRLIDDRAMTRKNRVGRENIELCTGSDPDEPAVASFPVQELVKILGEYRSGVRQRNCATETR